MARRRRPLVPEARDELDALKAKLFRVPEPEQAKYRAAAAQHIPLREGDNGNLTARDAGRIGGPLGGQMVKALIRSAQERLAQRQP